jgi:signal transduction histidine kinase
LANNAFLAQQRLERAAERGLSAAEARDEAAPFFSEIATGVDRINQLVEDLRKYTKARLDRTFAVQPLDPLVAAAVDLFRATDRTKHPVEISLAPTPRVRANKGAIQQVVINLLQNAADATPTALPIRVATREEAGNAVLEIVDRGVGMSAAVLRHMYDPLFTTKDDGTGLGLSIARRIVDEHRAHIECESEPGRGTKFRVIFPRVS